MGRSKNDRHLLTSTVASVWAVCLPVGCFPTCRACTIVLVCTIAAFVTLEFGAWLCRFIVSTGTIGKTKHEPCWKQDTESDESDWVIVVSHGRFRCCGLRLYYSILKRGSQLVRSFFVRTVLFCNVIENDHHSQYRDRRDANEWQKDIEEKVV